jgi:ribosomal protein S18 acetylase RimI-like enzyme
MRVETRAAVLSDALHVAENLRIADKEELLAGGTEDFKQCLVDSFTSSSICRVALVDGVPVAVLGVCDSGIAGVGVIWMLGTDGIYKISRQFLKGSMRELRMLANEYKTLFNYVYTDNKLSIKWLEWLGFTIDKQRDSSEFFRMFYRNVENV